jgi:hypothetical protein
MDVTKLYEFIWFGDIHGPKPNEFIGFRCAFMSQTPVVYPAVSRVPGLAFGNIVIGCTSNSGQHHRRPTDMWPVNVICVRKHYCITESRFVRHHPKTPKVQDDPWGDLVGRLPAPGTPTHVTFRGCASAASYVDRRQTRDHATCTSTAQVHAQARHKYTRTPYCMSTTHVYMRVCM